MTFVFTVILCGVAGYLWQKIEESDRIYLCLSRLSAWISALFIKVEYEIDIDALTPDQFEKIARQITSLREDYDMSWKDISNKLGVPFWFAAHVHESVVEEMICDWKVLRIANKSRIFAEEYQLRREKRNR